MMSATKASHETKSRRTRRTSQRDPRAITLLKQDHREVEAAFDEYEQLHDDKEKGALFSKIAQALKAHTEIEEELFYPREREYVEDDMIDEAFVEHDCAKKPGDQFYDAKVRVLGEYIKHHVREEEQPGGIFSQAKRGDDELEALGAQIEERKAELLAKPAGKKH
jgi:hypothetical protein